MRRHEVMDDQRKPLAPLYQPCILISFIHFKHDINKYLLANTDTMWECDDDSKK